MPGSSKTILVVEDEVALRTLLREKLENAGFKILTAEDGEAGVILALSEHPDLILLDILLPKLDGFTLLRQVRKDGWGKAVPVIVLTNLNEADKVAEGLQIGFAGSYDYLVKSDHTLDEIVTKVEEALHISH